MSNNYNNLFNDPAFQNISPKKREIMNEMFTLMNNKSTEQKIQILMAYGFKMKNMGLSLTKDESNLLMNSLKTKLSPKEKEKVDMLINMMNMMK